MEHAKTSDIGGPRQATTSRPRPTRKRMRCIRRARQLHFGGLKAEGGKKQGSRGPILTPAPPPSSSDRGRNARTADGIISSSLSVQLRTAHRPPHGKQPHCRFSLPRKISLFAGAKSDTRAPNRNTDRAPASHSIRLLACAGPFPPQTRRAQASGTHGRFSLARKIVFSRSEKRHSGA
jgi:hypothetical protein